LEEMNNDIIEHYNKDHSDSNISNYNKT